MQVKLHLEEPPLLEEIPFHTLHGIGALNSRWYLQEYLKPLQPLLNLHHLDVFHTWCLRNAQETGRCVMEFHQADACFFAFVLYGCSRLCF